MKNERCKTTGFVCAVLMTALITSQALAQRTPPPKRVKLEKHNRGYTVYTPPGLEEGKRYPAVIWLHPKGGSMNTRFRRDWWPDLKRRKIFMVLPKSAEGRTWGDADLPYLLDLARDLPSQFAIDRKKLVLFGYQAGGQMGFHLVRKSPRRFASIITMAAYPVTGMREPTVSLPSRSARKGLSILMVVGTADNGRVFCRGAAEQLKAARFAVGLIEVPGARQEYMLSTRTRILTWLESVAAGERPSVKPSVEETRARQALDETSRRMLAEILKTPEEPTSAPAVPFMFVEAGLSVRMPPGWKALADEPDSARLTTTVPPEGPLLVQLAHKKGKQRLKNAIRSHETRNASRGIRYRTLATEKLELGGQTWTLQQAACLSYHRQVTAGGRREGLPRGSAREVVDAPSMVTVCYRALDRRGTEYLRVVFLYTDATSHKAGLPGLVRTVLPSIRVLPKTREEGP